MRRFVREAAFRVARRDLLRFIEDHEQDLLRIFGEEMEKLDERMPEEQMFIDIHMDLLQHVILVIQSHMHVNLTLNQRYQ